MRAALSGLTAAVLSAVAFSFESALGNPFGFGLLLFGPLLIAVLWGLPGVAARTLVRNGVTAAVCGAIVLGVLVAAGNKEGGGLLVLFGAGTALFVVGVFPVILAAGLFGRRGSQRS